MARRRKATRRRTTKRGVNLVNAAELYLQTAIFTKNFAGTNPLTFLTGQEMGEIRTGNINSFGRESVRVGLGYFPNASSVTLPEMLGIGSARLGQGLDTIQSNFMANAIPAAMQSLGLKIGFTVGKKLTSKYRSMINNKILKPLNLKSVAVV